MTMLGQGRRVRHYDRMIWGVLSTELGSGALTAQRIFATPLIINFTMTVDRIGWMNGAVAQGSVKVGIYRDVGGAPGGGALIVGSVAVAVAGVNEKQEGTIADTRLTPNLYWLALLVLAGDLPTIFYPTASLGAGGTLQGYRADIASDNLPDPFPTPTASTGIAQYVRVKSVP